MFLSICIRATRARDLRSGDTESRANANVGIRSVVAGAITVAEDTREGRRRHYITKPIPLSIFFSLNVTYPVLRILEKYKLSFAFIEIFIKSEHFLKAKYKYSFISTYTVYPLRQQVLEL